MDTTQTSTNSSGPHASDHRPIAIWLLICCGAIFAMVLLGGVTRLTGSGLSMVQWDPVMGILPPLSHDQWEEAFRLYRQFPEYKYKNIHMELEQFKGIYWFEFAHRISGRAIGLIFFFPMLYFIIKGRISKQLTPQLVTIFVLGGLQGLLGWYLVKSGLAGNPYVSQYRLTAHLGLAFAIYAYMLWVALSLLRPKSCAEPLTNNRRLRHFSLLVAGLIFGTVLSGGFVAGLKAGLIYNTFPLMGGHWIPDGILSQHPVWRNFLENAITVQFDHRLLAAIVFFTIIAFWLVARRLQLPVPGRIGVNLLLGAMVLQIILGISTLLLQVPVPVAVAHQAGALLLFSVSLFVTHALYNR